MFGSSSLVIRRRNPSPVLAQSTRPSLSSSASSSHLVLLKSLRDIQDHSRGEGNLRSSHSCCTPNAIITKRTVKVHITVVYFPAFQTSSLIHCLRSVVRNRAAVGLRVGEERKGTCGRDRVARVFWVNGRREFGGRRGHLRSNPRIGSRGRIVVDILRWGLIVLGDGVFFSCEQPR
jgi:hypothetical protein